MTDNAELAVSLLFSSRMTEHVSCKSRGAYKTPRVKKLFNQDFGQLKQQQNTIYLEVWYKWKNTCLSSVKP
jgi:hypothetical protein